MVETRVGVSVIELLLTSLQEKDDAVTRLVLADALEEDGRLEEATWHRLLAWDGGLPKFPPGCGVMRSTVVSGGLFIFKGGGRKNKVSVWWSPKTGWHRRALVTKCLTKCEKASRVIVPLVRRRSDFSFCRKHG